MTHDDGVGGTFKYESDETLYDNGKSPIFKEAFELLSEVSTELADMQTKLDNLDKLQTELEELCASVTQQIVDAL